jgi:hypothetical protein
MKTRLVLIGAAGLIVSACSGSSKTMSDDLKKDLELASTSDGLTLAANAAKASQVVSAIERTTPPAPRRVAQSQRVVKHKPAPKAPPAPVETEVAQVTEEVEPQPVIETPAPTESAPAAAPRPHPIEMPSGSGVQVGQGGGSNTGAVLGGIISVVLRGGVVHGDECDPRTDGRRGRVGTAIAINSRIPVIRGTFPGSGRVRGF